MEPAKSFTSMILYIIYKTFILSSDENFFPTWTYMQTFLSMNNNKKSYKPSRRNHFWKAQ